MLIKVIAVFFVCLPAFGITSEYREYAEDAGVFFGVGDCLILGVIVQEGGTPGTDTRHDNGAVDSGLAQINKNGEWMKHFARRYKITYEQIRDNPYLSILLVGYILRTELDRSDDIFDAVSAYHRGYGRRQTVEGMRYAEKVLRWANSLRRSGRCSQVL